MQDNSTAENEEVLQSRENITDRNESEHGLCTEPFQATTSFDNNDTDALRQQSFLLKCRLQYDTGWEKATNLRVGSSAEQKEETTPSHCNNTRKTLPTLSFMREVLATKFGVQICELLQDNQADNKQQRVYTVSTKHSAFLFTLHCCTCLLIGTEVYVLDVRAESAKEFLCSFVPLLISAEEADLQLCLNFTEEDWNKEISSNHSPAVNLLKVGLTVLEVVLTVAFFHLNADLKALEEEDSTFSSCLPDHITLSSFIRFDKMKQGCSELKSKAEALKTLLVDIRNDEEAMVQVNMKIFVPREQRSPIKEESHPHKEQESDLGSLDCYTKADMVCREKTEQEASALEEVNDMLRYFLQRLEGIILEAERLLDSAQISEDSSRVILSLQNYHASRFKVKLSIGVLVASLTALLAAVFRTNFEGEIHLNRFAFLGFFMLSSSFLILFHESRSRISA